MKPILPLSLLLLFFSFPTLSQTDTGETSQIKMTKVRNNIYFLQSDGGNIGFCFGKNGIFMVDGYFPNEVEQLEKEIKKISDTPIKLVLNTHFHLDHTGGNIYLTKAGAIVMAQENTRDRLKMVINDGSKKMSDDMLPQLTFKEELRMHLNNEDISIFHVPNAHTDGDAAVYFKNSNILQTGDLFFNGEYPFIDVENGGSIDGIMSGLENILSVVDDNTLVIPGHGALATKKDLSDYLNMIGGLYRKIIQMSHQGKSENEILQNENLLLEFKAKGYKDGFISSEAFLKTLYKEANEDSQAKAERLQKNEEARKKYEQLKKKQNQNK